MNFLKKLAIISLVTVPIFFAGCGKQVIGYIDINKVMDESPRVKNLMTEAESKVTEAQNNFKDEQADKANLSDEEREKAQIELQRKCENIYKSYVTQLKNRLDVVIEEVARKKNIDAVLNSYPNDKAIFYGGIDITDEVIQKMQ